jgi:glycosyltransferase involved in cell wall biosynthesis
LKILRVIARLNMGGPARHVVLLNAGLDARGHHTLLVHGEVGAGEGSLEHLADVHGLRRTRVAELGPRIRLWGDLRALLTLLRLVFREQPDVVHSHTAKAGALARLSAAAYNAVRPRHRRALVLHTFHGHVFQGYFGALGNALVRTAERVLGRLTDCVITISPGQKEDIVRRFTIAAENRVVVIPLGLDLATLAGLGDGPSPLRANLGIPDDGFVVGFVGRFVPVKAPQAIAAAFAAVAAAVPNAWLLMVGDGPLRPEIEKSVQEMGLTSRVRLVGWTEDLAAVYGAIDVCVLASLNEGTPVALIEAMASGRMVVSPHVGGVPDLVRDGETGVLIPPGAGAADLAAAIVDLARSPERRRIIGKAARREVMARFSHERLVDDVDRLYGQLLPAKRQST